MKQICFLLMLISSGILGALEWEGVNVDFSFAWRYNAQIDSVPSGKQPDTLQFIIGASGFGNSDGERGGFFFQPGVWLTWTTEEVYAGITRPTDEATASHMKVLGLMADASFGHVFTAGDLDLGVQIGPSLYFRFPLWTAQNGTGNPDEFWTAYYGKAQFLYLALGSWVAIPVSDAFDFVVGVRIHQPLSNVWTGAPLLHDLQIGLLASLRFGILRSAPG